ncbi:putative serine/threonine protein kinase [Talaromyces proteolyticus]|uniref:Serine/threonine protein kinase n=1 Tax=Talaromyces proteolyticus TaxID=1131652 RepID=A0AAD4KXV4_9EURO|nr:putative serine/threonine protein kinase [Talaromyces proteolyticus]KAH8702519.1 putative serine/threonine protein kinase [Talaromyces proteolyticus]
MDCLKEKFVEGQLLDGRFRTVAPLNHGSFGMVFLAKDTMTDQDVAIKCLSKPTSSEAPIPVTIDERSEELNCHARLAYHPNIVNLIHSFETSSHFYLVLEYCSMGDLYEAIRGNRGPLETEHVRDFMLQLIDAVDFMHSNGLYHRDIKPENIFLAHDGSMKLGDFGLATRLEWCHEACVGSDRYMAPEQYEPPQAGYSPARADVWSIGICLLNILFARNPFVTPTESDILFADYVRDRQSLFDIFPNMSQDTFEILRHSLAIDPEKRTLSGMRDAIVRTVSFTTDDESLDEFCTEDRNVVPASANREPLRTPSIQSPYVNSGDSFPWAKALQTSPPQPIRQLSAIPDTEYYSEDLFPPSETAGTSWYSVQPDSPSIASVLDSAMGASYQSVTARQNRQLHSQPLTVRPVTNSLPSHAIKPLSAMSMVFGNNKGDQFSKSWSDLWDEEWEMEDASLIQRRENNARSWSQDSKEIESPVQPAGLFEPETSSFLNSRSTVSRRGSDSSASLPFTSKQDDSNKSTPTPHSHNRSPCNVTGRSNIDKWAALGDRRRKYQPREESPTLKKQRSMNLSWRRDSGPSRSPQRRNPFLDKEWRRNGDDIKAKPNIDYHGSLDEDLDLVGGWHDLHL